MRLTNAIRKEILDSVVSRIITPQVDKEIESLQQVAQATADSFYPKNIKAWIDGGPKDALLNRGSIYLRLSDKSGYFVHSLINDGRRNCFSLSKSFKVLNKDQYERVFTVTKNQQAKFKKIISKLDAIKEQKEKIKKTLTTALYSCNTRKQLEDNYPDLAKYLPEIAVTGMAMTVTNEAVKKILKAA